MIQYDQLNRFMIMKLIEEYNQYIQNANESGRYSEGWYPVSIHEFVNAEFIEIAEEDDFAEEFDSRYIVETFIDHNADNEEHLPVYVYDGGGIARPANKIKIDDDGDILITHDKDDITLGPFSLGSLMDGFEYLNKTAQIKCHGHDGFIRCAQSVALIGDIHIINS